MPEESVRRGEDPVKRVKKAPAASGDTAGAAGRGRGTVIPLTPELL